MVAEMPGNYWVWRVSEGGLVEPFKSKGSAMPAWKTALSPEDRWAVIAYAHTLSGHHGPHDASQHSELNPKPEFVSGEGTLIALRPDRQQVVVEHGEIAGFMTAMTMGYRGLFTIIKVRDQLTSYDSDPGWYRHPAGTVAVKASDSELVRDGIVVDASRPHKHH